MRSERSTRPVGATEPASRSRDAVAGWRCSWGVLLLAVVLFPVGAGQIAAQTVDDRASPFLPPGHWTGASLQRLHGLGLIEPGFDPGTGSWTRQEVARLFAHAVERADSVASPGTAELTHNYWDRYTTEFPEFAADAPPPTGIIRTTSWIQGGYHRTEDQVVPGTGYDNGGDWTGPAVEPTTSAAVIESSLSAGVAPFLAAAIAPSIQTDGRHAIRRGYGMLAWGPVSLWAGRRALRFGPGDGGGIVTNWAAPVDGAGLLLTRAIQLPFFLRHLGPFRFETSLSRPDEGNGVVAVPWLWLTRAYLEPHPRLGIGISRGLMAGTWDGGHIGMRELVGLVIGRHLRAPGTMDNDIVSIDLSYRPPLPVLPLLLYLEWGFEDSAGAWRDVPGIVAGARVPAVPFLPQLQLGLERTSFAPGCCGNPHWYRHWGFTDGWTIDGLLLGHPLGGHGREWRLYADTDLDDARIRMGGSAFLRDRRELNMFAPDREGRGVGGTLWIHAEVTETLDFIFDAVRETGSGWDHRLNYMGVRYRF